MGLLVQYDSVSQPSDRHYTICKIPLFFSQTYQVEMDTNLLTGLVTPKWPARGVSCATLRISCRQDFGTTIWCLTVQSSSTWTLIGLQFITKTPFFVKWYTGFRETSFNQQLSGDCSRQGFSVTIPLTKALSPARSFPRIRCTLSNGNDGCIPTLTGSVTTLAFK